MSVCRIVLSFFQVCPFRVSVTFNNARDKMIGLDCGLAKLAHSLPRMHWGNCFACLAVPPGSCPDPRSVRNLAKGRTVPPPLCYAQQRHLLPAYKQRWRLWQIIVAARQVSPRARRAAAALQASLKAHRKADARSSSIVHRGHARHRQCAQPRSGMWRIARCRRPRAALTTCCRVVAPSRRRSLARLLANGWASPHGWVSPWQT